MRKIIIGIHGLGNKPDAELLANWWKKSIREGLGAIAKPHYFYKFELVYWADVLHPTPLDPELTDAENPLYLEEIYTPSPQKKRPQKSENLRTRLYGYIEKQLDRLFLNEDLSINFSSITDKIIHHYFKDLEAYYCEDSVKDSDNRCMAKEVIREQLAAALRKHRRKDILLIGHSMGSIIAYDVLTQSVPDVKVDTFITLGSPLGLPIIFSRIFAEQKKNGTTDAKPATPENVRCQWFNISDEDDKIALDHTLADDFEASSKNVRAKDVFVYNDYEINGERNPHKIYGYLRTPEMAGIIDEFLCRGRWSWINRIFEKINLWLMKQINKIKNF